MPQRVTAPPPTPNTVGPNMLGHHAAEDAIDFPCSPAWARFYASRGMTTGYPPGLDYNPPDPQPLPLPDPLRSLQQYHRFYHMDLPSPPDEMQRELALIAPLEYQHAWFEERIAFLQDALNQTTVSGVRPPENIIPPARKGIEL